MWYGIIVQTGGKVGIVSSPGSYDLYSYKEDIQYVVESSIRAYSDMRDWGRMMPRLLKMDYSASHFCRDMLNRALLRHPEKRVEYVPFFTGESQHGFYPLDPTSSLLENLARIPLKYTVTMSPSESMYNPIRAAANADKDHERLFRFK